MPSSKRSAVPKQQSLPGPELLPDLRSTFLMLRDLLEEYAPSWYADKLRAKVDAVAQQIEKTRRKD